MVNQKTDDNSELATLALEITKGERLPILNDWESVLQLKESLDAKIIPKAKANEIIRQKALDMASKYFP